MLQHPDSLKELVELGKKLVAALVEDEETVGQFALLLSESLKVPILQAAVAKLLAGASDFSCGFTSMAWSCGHKNEAKI